MASGSRSRSNSSSLFFLRLRLGAALALVAVAVLRVRLGFVSVSAASEAPSSAPLAALAAAALVVDFVARFLVVVALAAVLVVFAPEPSLLVVVDLALAGFFVCASFFQSLRATASSVASLVAAFLLVAVDTKTLSSSVTGCFVCKTPKTLSSPRLLSETKCDGLMPSHRRIFRAYSSPAEDTPWVH